MATPRHPKASKDYPKRGEILKLAVSLGELAEGEYTCQITVLDPTGQKAAFWQAPVKIVP